MKATFYIVDLDSGQTVEDPAKLLELAKLPLQCGFDGIGIKDDGTPIVFDRCDGFNYLDPNRYNVIVQNEIE